MQRSQRLGWLDCCKGFAIILVVYGHMEKGIFAAGMYPQMHDLLNMTDRLVYSFHMPLFWMICGYTFYLAYCKDRAKKKNSYKKQLFNCIWVYFLFSTVQWTIQFLLSGVVNADVSVTDLLLMPIRPMSPYWFSFVLVIYYLFFYHFIRLKVPEWAKLIFVALLSTLAEPLDLDIVIPIRIVLLHMLFFYIGIVFAKYGRMIADSRPAFIVLSVLGLLLLGLSCAFDLPYIPFVTDVFVPTVIALFFFNLFYKVKAPGGLRPLAFIGTYSLEIYVTHCMITAGCRVILPRLGLDFGIPLLLCGTVLGTALPVLCAILFKKIKLHGLFFRPAQLFWKK